MRVVLVEDPALLGVNSFGNWRQSISTGGRYSIGLPDWVFATAVATSNGYCDGGVKKLL